MVGQARPFSRVTLGVGAALTLGFTSLVAPAVADSGDSSDSCEVKSWESIAEELLGDAEPDFCGEADSDDATPEGDDAEADETAEVEDDAEGDDTESDDSAEADDVEGEDAEGDDTSESADEDDKASALSTAGEDDGEREGVAEFSAEEIAEATQAVGASSSGQTVILVDDADAEMAAFIEEAYPGATVKSSGGPIEALAAISGDVVGGAGIYSESGGGQFGVCSIGFPAWSPDGDAAVITAGHCTDDGAVTEVGLSDPQGDDAVGGNFTPADDLGVYGFSQFGGPGNEPVDPENPSLDDVTDVAVIDVTNDDLTFAPEVTDWTSPEDLSSSTTPITGVASVHENGADIERSARTTGHRTAPATNVDISQGVAQVEDRLVWGFWIEGLEADGGDSGGAVYQGGNAIGLVSGGSDAGVWAADLQDALSYTDGYEVRLFVEAPEMTSPEDGGTVAAGSAISGTAPAGTTLVVDPEEGEEFEVEVDDSGEWSFPAPEDTAGLYEFSLQATKGFDESEIVDYSVEITISAPAFTSPEDGDVVNEPITEVTGTGLDDATVTLEVDGEEVDTATVVDGEWSIAVNLGYGEHELVASQERDGEESAEVTANVTVAPAAPAITSPEDGDAFDEGEVPAAVEGTGLNGATVALAVDGEEVGTAEVVDGEWSIDLPTGLDAGDYELTAVQTIEDVTSSETTVSITVNEEVVEDPGDEDSDEDESEDPGAGGGDDDSSVPTLPDTGISDGVAPALIAAGLLIAVGAGTRIWKRVTA